VNIELVNINKHFKDFALTDVNLEIRPGEFFVILGPSGAGKTLILEILAGLLTPDSGIVSGIDRRKVGFIYQDYMLFPHLDVFDNIGYGLRVRKQDKDHIRRRVEEIAGQLAISHLLHRRVDNLSGGEKQRVAIARAMAISPEIYLFDEPTAALDRNARLHTQRMFMELHRQSEATFVHVTHDFEEALTLADRLAILLHGQVRQTGRPDEVFNQPRSRDIADFLGYRNVYGGRVRSHEMTIDGVAITVPLKQADHAYVAIRGDDILLSRKRLESSARNAMVGTVSHVFRRAAVVEVVLDVGIPLSIDITRQSCQEMNIKPGDRLWATFKVSALKMFEH
jgi:molybdopterin-binding protein